MKSKTITKNYYRLYSPKYRKQIGTTSDSLIVVKNAQAFLKRAGMNTVIQVSSVVYTPFRRLK